MREVEAEAAGGSGGQLIRGVRLALLSPEWNRPCAACAEYWYQDDGRLKRDTTGEPLKRPKGAPTPCQSCAKVPKWAKEQGKDWTELRALADEMSAENEAAYTAYREWKATNSFPNDAVVRWYAGLIAGVEREADAVPVAQQTAAIYSLVQVLTMRFRR